MEYEIRKIDLMGTLFPYKIGIISLGSLMLGTLDFMILKGWQDGGRVVKVRVD